MQATESSTGLVTTVKSLYLENGIKRFYNGAIPILMGCIPAHAAFFGTYEFAKRKLKIEDGVFICVNIGIPSNSRICLGCLCKNYA